MKELNEMTPYEAYVENVKILKKNRNVLKKLFNTVLLTNNQDEIKLLTIEYAMLYSTYAEASFHKLIFTPDKLSDNYIKSILKVRAKVKNRKEKKGEEFASAIETQWNKFFEICLNKLKNDANKGEIANREKQIRTIFDNYISDKIHVRNKIAHGQWVVALTNDGTKVNHEIDINNKIEDFVRIDISFNVFDKFEHILEDLLKSPRTFFNQFYKNIEELNDYIIKTKDWKLETKIIKLKETVYRKKYLESKEAEIQKTKTKDATH